jgi:hypothetical protein
VLVTKSIVKPLGNREGMEIRMSLSQETCLRKISMNFGAKKGRESRRLCRLLIIRIVADPVS